MQVLHSVATAEQIIDTRSYISLHAISAIYQMSNSYEASFMLQRVALHSNARHMATM
jgi:hypothetical protein